MTRVEIIHEKLTAALNPTELDVIDNSAAHRGHAGTAGGAGHYTVEIASPEFSGKSKIACHQLIYAALEGMIPDEIHALIIKII
jgi:BolA protein